MSAALTVAGLRAERWFAALKEQGVDLTDNAHMKLVHESIEFADEPSLEEAADVFIALLGAMYQRGWTMKDLAVATQLKLEVNEGRTWAKQPDGTYQHT